LKLLFENSQNQFSPEILRNTLAILADATPFDYYYAKQSIARLELHLRTLIANLEKVCFAPMRLSTEFRDKLYNSLAKFAEIHQNTTQVIEERIISKKQNYNIDFLLTHLRDTLHSLRDDETWFQELGRRSKDLLKSALNIAPEILSTAGVALPNVNCSILSMLPSLSFKYPVASYYVGWRKYLWSFLEREWIDVTNKSILDSQTKFDEVSNK
ncbi:hypothetical protein RhiirA1_483950, partial [Rhizophagus irregularis]